MDYPDLKRAKEIPVVFICGQNPDGSAIEKKYKHYFPLALIAEAKPGSLIDKDSLFSQAFMSIMEPIIIQHHSEVYPAVQNKCNFCHRPKAQVHLTSISRLHDIEPQVIVMTFPSCFYSNCDAKVQFQMKEVITQVDVQDMINARILERKIKNKKEFRPCDICGEEDSLRCARCGDAFYCGKEHQKQDWARHKLDCTQNYPKNVLDWRPWPEE